eukprot:TRINITY_DN2684_c0_g1_i1.p1 TRINITY_DN2684_c0_g1~~TRINITY_DN2684_c0_g1_i1.p1  ORF type:complete len:196 (+),score=43.04 TRINITY_DN2684_c0_g1_i1:17-604(+)
MNLSEEVLKGLDILGDEKTLNDAAFKSLTDFSFGVLMRQKTEADMLSSLGDKSVDPIAVKQGFSALISFILEASKLNSDASVLSSVLEEHRVSSSRITYLSERYAALRGPLRKLLSAISFHFPSIVDVDWRLDYFIKANSIEKINVPVYRIALKTEEGEGQTGTVEFACSMEQLQDLVAKLKDAVKQIERSAART